LTSATEREARLKEDCLRILQHALQESAAGRAVEHHLFRMDKRVRVGDFEFDLASYNSIFLISVGKASVAMARAVEDVLFDKMTAAIVVTKEGHSGSLRSCTPMEAGHPIPNEAGERAALQIRNLVRDLTPRDLLILAVSGGASAILPAPAYPVTLRDKQQTTEALLMAGADIGELNAVRKHLSFLKGGLLAKLAWPATTVGLLLSDVIGDRLDVIGSGLTAPDTSTFADALSVLQGYDLLTRVPASVRDRLMQGAAGLVEETPKPGDPIFNNVHNVVVGSNHLALEAAAQEARRLGYRAIVASSNTEGEARQAASAQSALLRKIAVHHEPFPPPVCLLSGGETTVTVRGAGKGGRNQEFALAAAIDLAGIPGVAALSAGTDGTDGPTDAAGAIATGTTVARAQATGMQPEDYLMRNDSYPFFDVLGDLIRTGPTGTNVMDLQILLAQ
jgi:hydroxypyruvate reductase